MRNAGRPPLPAGVERWAAGAAAYRLAGSGGAEPQEAKSAAASTAVCATP